MQLKTLAPAAPLVCASCDSTNCACAKGASLFRNIAILAAITLIVGVLVWQGITSQGNPDPTTDGISRTAAIMNTGILVFREGLEAILVLAALTASLVRTKQHFWKPVAIGAGLSFLATIATWFIVVALLSSINAPALYIQAATGLLAIVVLLVIMNWFFHKIYWAGWITAHNRRKRDLTESSDLSSSAIFRGLLLIGFTSIYREGFEVVLFLQSIRLRVGPTVVLSGVCFGLALTLVVAFLTFVAHYRLPYRKMLILTGIMLGVVLLVMVGEQAQEMQQAGWLSTTNVNINMPDWLNVWFGVFPTVESLTAQGAAAVLVVGSYFLARHLKRRAAALPGNLADNCAAGIDSQPENALCQQLNCEDGCPIPTPPVQITTSSKPTLQRQE